MMDFLKCQRFRGANVEVKQPVRDMAGHGNKSHQMMNPPLEQIPRYCGHRANKFGSHGVNSFLLLMERA